MKKKLCALLLIHLFSSVAFSQDLSVLDNKFPTTRQGQRDTYEQVLSSIKELTELRATIAKRINDYDREANRLMFTDAIGARLQIIEATRCRDKIRSIDRQLKELDSLKKRLERHLN